MRQPHQRTAADLTHLASVWDQPCLGVGVGMAQNKVAAMIYIPIPLLPSPSICTLRITSWSHICSCPSTLWCRRFGLCIERQRVVPFVKWKIADDSSWAFTWLKKVIMSGGWFQKFRFLSFKPQPRGWIHMALQGEHTTIHARDPCRCLAEFLVRNVWFWFTMSSLRRR